MPEQISADFVRQTRLALEVLAGQTAMSPTDELSPLVVVTAPEVFSAQTQSIIWRVNSSTDALRNAVGQALGFANVFSIGVWFKPTVVPFGGSEYLVDIRTPIPNTNSLISLYHDASVARLRLDWGDLTGTPTEITAWNNFYTGEAGNWVHTMIVWTGTQMFVLKNGVDQGAPDVGSATPSITMDDALRRIALGNLATGGNSSIEGQEAQVQMWNADVRAAAAFLQASPSSIDLNVDSGLYTFSGNLAHWYRPGHETAPNIGKDFATAGITPTIDVGDNARDIDNGNRVVDVP